MVDDARHRQVENLFAAALEQPAAAREQFVNERTAGDVALAREIHDLLEADADAGGSADQEDRDVELEVGAKAGDRVGAYRLVRILGAGGMGTVWLAERDDDVYAGQVAIKLIKRGMESAEILRRFKQERQLLASLDHPGIARILDGGVMEDGCPFMVMEYVDGRMIDAYCREAALSLRARLELFLSVCQAVQHAHNNLVVHRDLKPGNILVTLSGAPKLLDFGIAKVLDTAEGDLLQTQATLRMLSPRYASPEQVRGGTITTASDVYTLGLILFELLTGESPYPLTENAAQALQQQVLTHDPVRPSAMVGMTDTATGVPGLNPRTLQRRLSGDLDTIILKALRKEPERRYSSVDQLATDIRRHLDGQPVLARGDSLRYRSVRFVQRNAVLVGAATVLGLVLVAAAVVSASLYLQADAARQQAAGEREVAQRVSGFLQDMLGSIDPEVAQGRDTELLSELIDRASGRIDGELGDAPLVAASLHHTLGVAKLSLAENEAAESHLRRAVELQRAGLAAGDPESVRMVVVGLRDLGRALHESGRYEAAEEPLREAVTLGERRLAGDDPELALARFRLAQVLEVRGGYGESEKLLRHAVDDLRRNGSAADRVATLAGLGSFVMYNQQAYAEAETLFTEALDLAQDDPAAGVLAEAFGLERLASVKRRQGQDDAAEELYRRALAAAVAVLPGRHPVLANFNNELATLLENQSRYDEAEALYREALSTQREILGTDHRNVGTTCNNLAGALRKAGRHAEAEPLYADAVRIYRASLGPDHAWVAIVLGNRAHNQFFGGDFVAGEATAREGLQVSAHHWPPEHWRIAALETVVGGCLSARGDFAGAERLLLGSLAKLENGEGSPEPRIRMAREQLAELYSRWGRPEQAAVFAVPLQD